MRIFVLLPLLIVLGMSFSLAQDSKSELRTWTAVNGKKVEAEFVSNSDGQVSLKMKTGKIFKVPLNKLSKADKEFLKAQLSPAKPLSAETSSEESGDTLNSLSDADVERLLKEAVELDSLEKRDGLFYQTNESESFSGWAKSMYDTGKAKELVPFKNGALNGIATKRYENGKKEAEATFVDGKEDGLKTYWYENGQKEKEGSYKKGKRDGLRTYWHENGQKQREVVYKEGEEISTKYWNSKGEEVAARRETHGVVPLKEQVKLAFVTNASADYWLYAEAGISKAIAEFDDIEVEFIAGNGTATKQREQVEALLVRGFKGIAICPCNPKEQKDMLNEWAKKTTLITIDSDAADTSRKLYLGTDNVAAGRQAGKLLKEALPHGGKVMAFVGLGDQASAVERYQGLKEAVDGTKIEILGLLTDEVNFDKARRNAEFTITKYPDIAGMVGLWSYNAPLILEAVQNKGFLGKVKIVAFDEDLRTLKAIDEGGIYGAVVQQPFELGYRSAKALRSLIVEKKTAQDLSVPEPNQQFIETLIIGKGQGISYLQKLQEWKSSGTVKRNR